MLFPYLCTRMISYCLFNILVSETERSRALLYPQDNLNLKTISEKGIQMHLNYFKTMELDVFMKRQFWPNFLCYQWRRINGPQVPPGSPAASRLQENLVCLCAEIWNITTNIRNRKRFIRNITQIFASYILIMLIFKYEHAQIWQCLVYTF